MVYKRVKIVLSTVLRPPPPPPPEKGSLFLTIVNKLYSVNAGLKKKFVTVAGHVDCPKKG